MHVDGAFGLWAAASRHSSWANCSAAAISPPRFELVLKPGERSRQVIEISNTSTQASTYKVYTGDWALAPDGGVTFQTDLEAGSCRPWVAVERHEITVPGGGRYRFRFEVEAPADTPARARP